VVAETIALPVSKKGRRLLSSLEDALSGEATVRRLGAIVVGLMVFPDRSYQ